MEYQGPGFRDRPRPAQPGERTPARGFPPARQGPEEFDDTGAEEFDDTVTFVPAALEPETTPAAVNRRRGRQGKSRSVFRSHPVLLSVALVVVLAAGGLTGYKLLDRTRANAPVTGSVRLPTYAPGSSGSPGFDQALGRWQHIGTRSQDPAALTITGLYPPQFVLNGSSYTRTAASATKSCSLAVYGSQLQTALQSGHCNQVLRASYLSGDSKMMGTIGVANLISANAAQKAGQTSGPQQIIAPLSARSGPTKKLGNGTGVVQAVVKGHYLILMWAEFTNLKTPSTAAARAQLEQFANNLFIGSANINLSTRMLGGKT